MWIFYFFCCFICVNSSTMSDVYTFDISIECLFFFFFSVDGFLLFLFRLGLYETFEQRHLNGSQTVHGLLRTKPNLIFKHIWLITLHSLHFKLFPRPNQRSTFGVISFATYISVNKMLRGKWNKIESEWNEMSSICIIIFFLLICEICTRSLNHFRIREKKKQTKQHE